MNRHTALLFQVDRSTGPPHGGPFQSKILRKSNAVWRFIKDGFQAYGLPRLCIDLMQRESVTNDPFYGNLVEKFYRDSIAAHPRYRIIPSFTIGVAVCDLRCDAKPYLARIEDSGKRNVKKAVRLGYRFEPLDHNAYLQDIAEIRSS